MCLGNISASLVLEWFKVWNRHGLSWIYLDRRGSSIFLFMFWNLFGLIATIMFEEEEKIWAYLFSNDTASLNRHASITSKHSRSKHKTFIFICNTCFFLPLEVVQRELICFQSLPVSSQNILVFPTFLCTLLKHNVTLWE